MTVSRMPLDFHMRQIVVVVSHSALDDILGVVAVLRPGVTCHEKEQEAAHGCAAGGFRYTYSINISYHGCWIVHLVIHPFFSSNRLVFVVLLQFLHGSSLSLTRTPGVV